MVQPVTSDIAQEVVTRMAKTVWVDTDACISCGLCVSLAPEVFKFVDGKSFAYDPAGAPQKKSRNASMAAR